MLNVIGNKNRNKQLAMVVVVLYNSKNYVQTNEVTDFLKVKITLRKRSNRFHEHTLAESER